jgi:chemotaxis signal transduction protein
MQLLMIRVGDGCFAVAADAVTHIVDPAIEPGFERAPGAERARWRGADLPVLDPARTLGTGGGTPGLFLLIEGAGGSALLPVDAAEAIRDIRADAIAPLPDFIFAGARRVVRGVFEDGGRPRLLLDETALS